MKKIITLIVLITISTNLLACDICGCGAGGSFLGIIPQFGRTQFGIRSSFRTFDHPNTILNVNGNSIVQRDENFQTDFTLRLFKKNRIQYFFQAPYKINTRYESLRTTTLLGIGDIQVGATYTLIQQQDSSAIRFKNLLAMGGGFTLPTGKYMQRDETKVIMPALFQLGSGAFQYNANLYYSLRYKRWGAMVNAQYVYAEQNEMKYQFGQRYQSSLALFYRKDFSWKVQPKKDEPVYLEKNKTLSVIPSIGWSTEHSEKDLEYGVVKPYTGGTQYLVQGALDVYYQKFAFNIFFQQSYFNDIPIAQPENKVRVGAGLTWVIG
ncbi:MAG: hypothetical protein R2809_02325 [Flavobacteriales bacterium]